MICYFFLGVFMRPFICEKMDEGSIKKLTCYNAIKETHQ